MEKISEVTEKQFLEVIKLQKEELENYKIEVSPAILEAGKLFAMDFLSDFEQKIKLFKIIGAIE